MNELMTRTDREQLARCEEVINSGLKTFLDVGEALAVIRDDRLYRSEFQTFGQYCRARWGFNDRRASQLISAADVVSTIVETGLPAPANEGQARALARVPESDRAAVWQATVERTEGHPTAAAVHETAGLLAGDEWVEPDDAPPTQTTVADHAPMETVTPTVTTPPKRRPLPAAFDDAVSDVGKSADRLHRLTEDDRFGRNREQVQHRMPELLAALRTAADALVAMDPATAQASEEARRWWAASLNTLSQTLAGLAASINTQDKDAI